MKKDLFEKVEKLKKSVKGKLVDKSVLYRGSFINLISEKYELPNKKIIRRESINKNNNKESVIIISITEDNKFLLVFQNRVNNLTTIEFPSGYIEEKESIKQAAKRELEEETGYITNDIIALDSCYSQLGIDSSKLNIVIAKNCIKKNKQSLGQNEYINYCEFTFKELCSLIENNYIIGCVNKLAFYEFVTNYRNFK